MLYPEFRLVQNVPTCCSLELQDTVAVFSIEGKPVSFEALGQNTVVANEAAAYDIDGWESAVVHALQSVGGLGSLSEWLFDKFDAHKKASTFSQMEAIGYHRLIILVILPATLHLSLQLQTKSC